MRSHLDYIKFYEELERLDITTQEQYDEWIKGLIIIENRDMKLQELGL
jgi:hypothetical protein